MRFIVVMTGFHDMAMGKHLSNVIFRSGIDCRVVDGREVYQQMMMTYWQRDVMAKKHLLMAAQQVVTAQVLELLQEGKSVVVDFSWIPKCKQFLTNIQKLGSIQGVKVIGVQGVFRDVEQYKESMRHYTKKQSYGCLFATNIHNGYVWSFQQASDERILYYKEMPFQWLEVFGGRQTDEGFDKVCTEVLNALFGEYIKMGRN